MRMILIVNTTSDRAVTSELASALSGKCGAFEVLELSEKKISHCIGCNYCWLKTPGVCSIKDDYEEILKKMLHALGKK